MIDLIVAFCLNQPDVDSCKQNLFKCVNTYVQKSPYILDDETLVTKCKRIEGYLPRRQSQESERCINEYDYQPN